MCIFSQKTSQKTANNVVKHKLSIPFYSVHLETQFFLTPVSPVEDTETGLTGGGKDKIQNGGLK